MTNRRYNCATIVCLVVFVGTGQVCGQSDFVRGDVNADGIVNAIDIDMTYDAARVNSTITVFDLDGNGVVNQTDGAYLVGTILGTLGGDANLDGVVDGSDFNLWNDHKFQDCSTGWSTGDFNGDAATDGSDFVGMMIPR